MRDDKVYLNHILEAISSILEYTTNQDPDSFKNSKITQDAVIRQIEIIGEAAKMLSSKIKDESKNIPWKEIVGMRDKLIHGYFGVDLKSVWKTIKEDIPVLKKGVNKIIKELK